MNRYSGKYFRSLLISLMVAIVFVPVSAFAQSLGTTHRGG